MLETIPRGFFLLRDAYRAFNADSCRLMAGAIAYYTLFALPIVLLMSVYAGGFFFGAEAAEGQLDAEIQELVGETSAQQVRTIIDESRRTTSQSAVSPFFALGLLLWGAIRAFEQLQEALNRVWAVDLDPKMSGIRKLLKKRVLSFGMICCIITVLAVSLAASLLMTYFALQADANLTAGLSGLLLRLLDFVASFTVITILFALIYKVMPDAQIAWSNVWVGAVFASLIFVISKFLIGFWLGRSNIGSAYGAAGSLAILLLWIYFSALILLYGAEFTKIWSKRYGQPVIPAEDAVALVVEVQEVPAEELAGEPTVQS